jgi:hypothetical protein
MLYVTPPELVEAIQADRRAEAEKFRQAVEAKRARHHGGRPAAQDLRWKTERV